MISSQIAGWWDVIYSRAIFIHGTSYSYPCQYAFLKQHYQFTDYFEYFISRNVNAICMAFIDISNVTNSNRNILFLSHSYVISTPTMY